MNGEDAPLDDDGVPSDDRGLAYGDGVFETLAVTAGRPLALEAHLERLERGCGALRFAPPPRAVVQAALAGACRDPRRGVVKIIVTRGSGGRGYAPPAAPTARIRVTRSPWPQGVERMRDHGVAAVTLATRLGDSPRLAGLKHLNRLEQVLAAAELADRAPAEEGIVCDLRGRPVCGVMSNLFLVRGGRLVTPALRHCGVAGIIRGAILHLTQTGALAAPSVREVASRELAEADEMFLTNSVRGVMPVRRLDGRDLDAPGPITVAVRRALDVASWLA